MAKKYLDYDGLLYFWQKLKATFVTDVTYDSTSKKIQKTKSGTTSDVVTLSTVATTNSYSDLSNKPTIPSAGTGSSYPAMDGTRSLGSSAGYARVDHVHPTDTSRAPLASPALTGTPTAPTAATTTNNTQIATTAFVKSVVGSMTSGVSDVTVDGTSVVTNGVANIPYANEDGYGVVKLEDNGSLDITWTDVDSNELTYCLPYLDQNSKIGSGLLPAATSSELGAVTLEAKYINPSADYLEIGTSSSTKYQVPRLIDNKLQEWWLPDASTTAKGAMSSTDKAKLDSITMTNGVIDSSVLPSFVDDVVEAYARTNQTELGSTWLATGSASGTVITPETGKIYVLMNDSTNYSANSQFRWGGSAYVKLSDGGVSSITNAEIDTIVAS